MTGTLISANIGAPAVSREDALKSTRKIFLDNILKGAPWLRLRLTTRSIKIMIMGQHSFITWVDSFFTKKKQMFLSHSYLQYLHSHFSDRVVCWSMGMSSWQPLELESGNPSTFVLFPTPLLMMMVVDCYCWWCWWRWWQIVIDNTAGDDSNRYESILPHLCSSQSHSLWWWWLISGDADNDDDNTAGD